MLDISNNDKSGRWPVKNTPYPLPEAILLTTESLPFLKIANTKCLLSFRPKGIWIIRFTPLEDCLLMVLFRVQECLLPSNILLGSNCLNLSTQPIKRAFFNS